jgi:glycosyltransferase involved in cell wall biosynthesis
MQISVVLCTRNRAEQLRSTLESATRMRIPDGLAWEFVLVDNGSTDHTADVVADFEGRLPIRRVVETTPGLSNARNCGVAAARGDLICWTDDDVIIDPNWIAAYAEAFARHPEATVFGGAIEPVFEREPPQWWFSNRSWLGNIYAARDFGAEEIELSSADQRLPFGANFAVRRKEQAETLYDPELGVGPMYKRLGEETAVVLALLEGRKGYWVPGARVKHIIPEKRLGLGYVADYYRALGESWAFLSQRDSANILGASIPAGGRRIKGMPVWLMRKAGVAWIKAQGARLHVASEAWLKPWTDFQYLVGALNYCRNNAR